MKIIFIFLLLFVISCEKIIYGDYRIIDVIKNDKQTSFIHLVNSGENLHLISKRYNVSLKQILKINNIRYPFKIFPNQKIILPTRLTHIIKKGETLYSISRKYNVDRFILCKINNIKSENKIYSGQKLFISSNEYKVNKKKKNNDKKSKKKTKSEVLPNSNSLKFLWPVKGEIILKYGQIKPGYHNDGINIRTAKDIPVKASETGKIIYTGNEIPGYGNLVLIKHSKNWITAYAHLKKIEYEKGSFVKKGEVIGIVGQTGNVSIPQLHFEIRKGKKAMDPKRFLL